MVKLQNGLVILPEFMTAFSKLMAMEIPVSQCVALSTAIEEIETQINIINRSREVILNKYCLKDKNGKALVDSKNNATFENKEIEEKCLKDINDIMVDTFEIHLDKKVTLDKTVKMSPQEYMFVKDLVIVEE
jgi:hypothetical protein